MAEPDFLDGSAAIAANKTGNGYHDDMATPPAIHAALTSRLASASHVASFADGGATPTIHAAPSSSSTRAGRADRGQAENGQGLHGGDRKERHQAHEEEEAGAAAAAAAGIPRLRSVGGGHRPGKLQLNRGGTLGASVCRVAATLLTAVIVWVRVSVVPGVLVDGEQHLTAYATVPALSRTHRTHIRFRLCLLS